jgi:hypothetical protein
MNIEKAVNQVFLQLTNSLNQITVEQYYQPCESLSGNTVGQHVRHIIEMFQCLEEGYNSGEIDYEKRKRDKQIETNREIAKDLLHQILRQIIKSNKPISMLVYYDDLDTGPEQIQTNYYREIAYNIEHTIHHMALIRIGLREIGDLYLDDSYGVANSTIKHLRKCAQ